MKNKKYVASLIVVLVLRVPAAGIPSRFRRRRRARMERRPRPLHRGKREAPATVSRRFRKKERL